MFLAVKDTAYLAYSESETQPEDTLRDNQGRKSSLRARVIRNPENSEPSSWRHFPSQHVNALQPPFPFQFAAIAALYATNEAL
jgi:hypothetical protein